MTSFGNSFLGRSFWQQFWEEFGGRNYIFLSIEMIRNKYDSPAVTHWWLVGGRKAVYKKKKFGRRQQSHKVRPREKLHTDPYGYQFGIIFPIACNIYQQE